MSRIRQILEQMDIPKLTKIINEAKTWIASTPDQARDQLLDSPQLAYALYVIPDILDQKYQDQDAGRGDVSFNIPRTYHTTQAPQYQSGQLSYKTAQMNGVFIDFQGQENNEQPPPQPQNMYGNYPTQYQQPDMYAQPMYTPMPSYGIEPGMPQQNYAPTYDTSVNYQQQAYQNENEIKKLLSTVHPQQLAEILKSSDIDDTMRKLILKYKPELSNIH